MGISAEKVAAKRRFPVFPVVLYFVAIYCVAVDVIGGRNEGGSPLCPPKAFIFSRPETSYLAKHFQLQVAKVQCQ